MSEPKCATCRWFRPLTELIGDESLGRCHRRAPTGDERTLISSNLEFCGEHEEKPRKADKEDRLSSNGEG